MPTETRDLTPGAVIVVDNAMETVSAVVPVGKLFRIYTTTGNRVRCNGTVRWLVLVAMAPGGDA